MRYLIAILFALIASTTNADDPTKEVESAMEVLNDAFTAQDAAKIRALMAPNHLAITPFAGKQSLEEQLRTLPELKYDEYSASPMSATIVNEACVLVTYTLKAKGSFKGKPVPSHCLVAAVWVKNDGKWQELHYQETAVVEP